MLRRLFTLASAASLVLCATAVLLLVASQYGRVIIRWESPTYGVDTVTVEGDMLAAYGPGTLFDRKLVIVRIATVVACFALLPVASLARVAWVRWRGFRRRASATANRCPACGYDIRATPGRCPECGKVPTEVESGG